QNRKNKSTGRFRCFLCVEVKSDETIIIRNLKNVLLIFCFQSCWNKDYLGEYRFRERGIETMNDKYGKVRNNIT
ncbi:hypothetical protein, partial [Filifactor alocis]